ncbi:MAG: helix-turn-helix transcriptional regulator [Chloroflexi bacterium]|nr:helix-turn-helix transcriptional regulator [Chloroflexota bacterium]
MRPTPLALAGIGSPTIDSPRAPDAKQRQALGLSQTEVAARMGSSQSVVARIESGEVDTRLSTLERYAAALGKKLSWSVS